MAALLLAAQLVSAQEPRRIVAIGDIHGAYDQFVSILTRTGLIDAQQKWAGGRTTFVQTGDYTDRGAKVRQVFDLLMALEEGARSARGQVVTLLGNHEVLNILGDMRYVTPEICSAFVDERSESRRESGWNQYESLATERAKVRTTLAPVYRQTREEWMAAHPPGWLEYREALSARGKYGRWLRGKPIAANLDGTIFMHAGISPDLPATVDAVNTRARDEMTRYEAYVQKLVEARLALSFFTFDELLQLSNAELEAAAAVMEAAKAKGAAPDLSAFNVPLLREALEITKITEWSLAAPEGPLWFRGYANWPDDEPMRAKVSAFLDQSGVKRIVVGHTPTPDSRITPRFGGRVFIIDTGMLTPVYKGRPSALEILGTRLTAIYEDGAVPLTTSSSPAKLLER
jgi:Calcineurin-like phosphoesterase